MEATPNEIHEAFSGEIDLSSSEALTAKMVEHTYRGTERMVLDVSSPGGKVVPSFGLYQALRSTPFELVTRNTSEVASMAVVLFLAGDTRLASLEATFLVHAITSTDTSVPMNIEDWRRSRTRFEGLGNHTRVVEADQRINYLAAKENQMLQIIGARTKLTRSEVEALVLQAQPISATDALDMGIVHEVIPASRS
jgi:ATP-dependent protease ClpP protease subunit